MDEEKILTVYDSEAKILEMISKTDDPAELEKLANALDKVRGSITDEIAKASQLELEEKKYESEKELEEKKYENEKKRGRWQTVVTILAALIGAGGAMGAQWVKGEMDSRYQDEGYSHEKTESVIWNKNRHRR